MAKRDGSVSAEHGLGVMKAPYIGYSQTKTSVELMKRIKAQFDPKGILNPYKVSSCYWVVLTPVCRIIT